MGAQQLAQRAQPLELTGPVEPVARRRALWLDEARTLDVAQHAGGPAGGLGSLVDGQGVLHGRPTLPRVCQGLRRLLGGADDALALLVLLLVDRKSVV